MARKTDRPTRVRILGRYWTLVDCPRLSDWGRIDAPNKTEKKLRLFKGMRGKLRLEILIHEVVHGAQWHVDEEYVKEFAEDLARILWRFGYRSTEE